MLFSGLGASSSAPPVALMMFNSLIMALAIALGKIAISIIAAYAIVYFRFPLRNDILLDDLRHAHAAGRSKDHCRPSRWSRISACSTAMPA